MANTEKDDNGFYDGWDPTDRYNYETYKARKEASHGQVQLTPLGGPMPAKAAKRQAFEESRRSKVFTWSDAAAMHDIESRYGKPSTAHRGENPLLDAKADYDEQSGYRRRLSRLTTYASELGRDRPVGGGALPGWKDEDGNAQDNPYNYANRGERYIRDTFGSRENYETYNKLMQWKKKNAGKWNMLAEAAGLNEMTMPALKKMGMTKALGFLKSMVHAGYHDLHEGQKDEAGNDLPKYTVLDYYGNEDDVSRRGGDYFRSALPYRYEDGQWVPNT